jgi:hypothetical protein
MSWRIRAVKLLVTMLFAGISFGASNLPQATSEQVENFRNQASLHRLRLGAGALNLLGNEDFLKAFPQYRRLADRKEDVLHVTLNHDYNKVHIRRDHPVVQTFASAYGIDYRSLAPEDPKRKQIIANRDALNRLDKKSWEKSVASQFRNKGDRRLLTELVETLDFHDTAQARKTEFGDCSANEKCRRMEGASKWLHDKGSEMGLKEPQKKRMISLADFIEQKMDYQAIIKRFPESSLKEKSFGTMAKELRLESLQGAQKVPEPVKFQKQAVQESRGSSTYGKLVKGAARAASGPLALVSATAVAADYISDPLSVKGSDLAHSLLFLRETSSCASPGCHRFKIQCLQEKLSEPECVKKFFENPLQDQYELRRDSDLNQLLSHHSPPLLSLRCEPNGAFIQFRNRKGDLQNQSIKWDNNFQLTKVQIKDQGQGQGQDQDQTQAPIAQVFFNRGEPSSLQYFHRQIGFQTLLLRDWFNQKIYFWSGETKEKMRAITEAQEADRFLKNHKEPIQKCCSNLICRDFFIDKKTDFPRDSKKNTSSAQ